MELFMHDKNMKAQAEENEKEKNVKAEAVKSEAAENDAVQDEVLKKEEKKDLPPLFSANELVNIVRSNQADAAFVLQLKELCSLCFLNERADEAKKLLPVYREAMEKCDELRPFLLQDLSLLACTALKKKEHTFSEAAVKTMFSGIFCYKTEDVEQRRAGLVAVSTVSAAMGRMRYEKEFFQVCLSAASYLERRKKKVGSDFLELLLSLLFSAADRKWLQALDEIAKTAEQTVLAGNIPAADLAHFLIEWGVLAAQIAQRGWKLPAQKLMQDLCRVLLQYSDRKTIKAVFSDAVIHIQMYSSYENAAEAVEMYCPWFDFMLLLADKYISLWAHMQRQGAEEESEELVKEIRFILRSVRNLVANMARLNMKEEAEVYEILLKKWQELAENKEEAKKIRTFVQLTIVCWYKSQPGRGNRQQKMLEPLLKPWTVFGVYARLVDEVL